MLTNNELDFESKFRGMLPCVSLFKMRMANGDLLLSFKEQRDFLVVVRAASSANIVTEIGWLFDSKRANLDWEVSCCFLRLQLTKNSLDDRLQFLLEEISKYQARTEYGN